MLFNRINKEYVMLLLPFCLFQNIQFISTFLFQTTVLDIMFFLNKILESLNGIPNGNVANLHKISPLQFKIFNQQLHFIRDNNLRVFPLVQNY